MDHFQSDEEVRCALLSITACATGLTLTAASTVVFSELYFTPATMIQAEDRAHRIGQNSNSVNIHYLYGEGTCDNIIFNLLNKKFRIVAKTLDRTEDKMNIEKTDNFGSISEAHVIKKVEIKHKSSFFNIKISEPEKKKENSEVKKKIEIDDIFQKEVMTLEDIYAEVEKEFYGENKV